MSHPKAAEAASTTLRLSLLQRLGRERQAPGGLRIEALGELAMRSLPVGEPRLETLRPSFR